MLQNLRECRIGKDLHGYLFRDREGNMLDYRFEKAVINSKVRGVYSEVNEILAGTASQELLDKYAPVMESLMAAKELAVVFEKAAKARGNMDLSSDETKFVLDENGVCIDLLPRTTGESEQLIEQMMIAANIASAKAALKAEIPFLYRVPDFFKPFPDDTALYRLPLPGHNDRSCHGVPPRSKYKFDV